MLCSPVILQQHVSGKHPLAHHPTENDKEDCLSFELVKIGLHHPSIKTYKNSHQKMKVSFCSSNVSF